MGDIIPVTHVTLMRRWVDEHVNEQSYSVDVLYRASTAGSEQQRRRVAARVSTNRWRLGT